MGMDEWLVVDLGSTRVTWRGPGGSGAGVHHGQPGALLAARGNTPIPRRLVIGSVAAKAVNEELRATLRREWKIEPEWLHATAEAYGVRNAYRDPAALGIDRWAALVAGFRAAGGPVLVADCGTALTLDYVDRAGRHHGGVIAPGLGAMRETLLHSTRLSTLKIGRVDWRPAEFGTDTASAINAGCLAAATALLERTRLRLEAGGAAVCKLLITGGDATTLLAGLSAPWRHMPELVLDGLALLAGGKAA